MSTSQTREAPHEQPQLSLGSPSSLSRELLPHALFRETQPPAWNYGQVKLVSTLRHS